MADKQKEFRINPRVLVAFFWGALCVPLYWSLKLGHVEEAAVLSWVVPGMIILWIAMLRGWTGKKETKDGPKGTA